MAGGCILVSMVDYRAAESADSTNLATPMRVLTIGAHPDDAEFGAGATLAKWSAAGAHITIMVLTDGSKGTWDPEIPGDRLVEIRAAEQKTAAAALGVKEIINLGYPDGELEYSMDLRAAVCLRIRHTRPNVVLAHDPWRRYMLHPDHRAAGWAAIDGVVAARDHLFFPAQLVDGITHHRPDAVLLWAPDEPDHWEDANGFLDSKVEALLAHSSQSKTTMSAAGSSDQATDEFRDMIYERAGSAAGPSGLVAAEAFKKIVP